MHEEQDSFAENSDIKSYLGIDKREGLVTIAKRLVGRKSISNFLLSNSHYLPVDTSINGLNVRWQKSFKEENLLMQHERPRTIALSAFMLTSLPSPFAQKEMVQEMWDSGAHTIILIDHDSPEGFKAVAHAREYLLQLGQREVDDPEANVHQLRGAHVLAPVSMSTSDIHKASLMRTLVLS